MIGTDRVRQLFQVIPGDDSVTEDVGCHDDTARARIKEGRRVVRIDASADLKPSGPRGEGGESLCLCRFIVRGGLGIQHDYMTAGKAAAPVELCKPGSVPFRDVILLRAVSEIAQSAADDLLDRTIVDIDTWTKFHTVLLFCRKRSYRPFLPDLYSNIFPEN